MFAKEGVMKKLNVKYKKLVPADLDEFVEFFQMGPGGQPHVQKFCCKYSIISTVRCSQSRP